MVRGAGERPTRGVRYLKWHRKRHRGAAHLPDDTVALPSSVESITDLERCRRGRGLPVDLVNPVSPTDPRRASAP